MYHNAYKYVIYITLILWIDNQVQNCIACQITEKSCVSVYDCPSVKALLYSGISTGTTKYLRSLSCGFKGDVPLVCCPEVQPPTDSTPVMTMEPLSGNENFLAPPMCGRSNVSFPKIVGGIPAKLGEFPWVVALGYQNKKNPNQPRWLCGGTLITHKHVITAAHCVHNKPELYLVRVGELDLYDENDGANPTDIRIANAKVHEEYNKVRFTTDIAILTLEESTKNLVGVWPICLPWETQYRNNSFLGKRPFVAGWGAVFFNGPTSSILRLTTIPIVENSQCKTAYQSQTEIDERIICAGYAEGQRDACQGDSGGPLMYGTIQRNQKIIQFYLIGIVSYGFRCAEPGYPGVYTRVTHFLNWIGKNIN